MNAPLRLRPLRTALAALALIAAVGCSTHPTASGRNLLRSAEPPPPPLDTPVTVLHALQYGYENMDFEFLKTLFTDDFVFVFGTQDSAGNAFRDRPWTREDEVLYLQHLLEGGGIDPPADRITLDFTNTLRDFPSDRTGHDPTWHRQINAEVNLRIQRGESTLEVRGPALFYFVRGDSAAIPPDLAARGFAPDPNRWWIDRWEDQTLSTGVAGVARVTRRPADIEPARATTWGSIKAMYR